MKFVVDADVASEPTRQRPDRRAIAWLHRHELECAVNPIIFAEIQIGILTMAAGQRRRLLEQWFEDAIRALDVLDIDAETAEVWAALVAELRRKGRTMPVKDSLIAATARQHGLTVATRNVADYRYAGVKIVNPFA